MNSHAFCISIYNKVFKFRKWFKYGLMAQKFQKQHAPSIIFALGKIKR